MSPAQLCVTPGSVCLLFDNVSNINYSNIPFQFSYNCVFLFKGTRVTFDWTSGHNMQEVDIGFLREFFFIVDITFSNFFLQIVRH